MAQSPEETPASDTPIDEPVVDGSGAAAPGGDPWASLLGDLGVEVNEEPSEQPQVPSVSPVPEPLVSDDTPLPTRPASDWDSLLDDFGLDAPADPPRESTATVETAPAQASETASGAFGQAEVTDAVAHVPGDGTSDDDLSKGQPPTDIEEPAGIEEPAAGFADAEDDEDIAASQGGDEPATDETSPTDRGGFDSFFDGPPTGPPTEPPTGPPTELTEPIVEESPLPKIEVAPKSQLTLPDWFPFAGRRSKTPPPAEVVEQPPEEQAPAASPAEPPADGDRVNDADNASGREELSEEPAVGGEGPLNVACAAGEGDAAEDPDGASLPKRRRRGRRRRRGKGPAPASADAATPSAPEGIDEAFTSEDLGGDDVVADALESVDGPTADPEAFDDEADSAAEGGRRPRTAASRQIPSWGETIGVVVDANIAARSERKRASRNGSRGGSGRGRPRGRRKKKTS